MPRFRVTSVRRTHLDFDRIWVEPVDRPAHQGPVFGDVNFWVENNYLAEGDFVSICKEINEAESGSEDQNEAEDAEEEPVLVEEDANGLF